MTVDFYNETDIEIDRAIINRVKGIVLLTLEEEGFNYDVEISITAVSNEDIQVLNKKYRNINKETDVLSFPCFNLKPRYFSEAISSHTVLGDIVISVEKAIEQADMYGHSLLRELCFLVCHSVLHLLGYDHMTKAEEDIMFERQNEILVKAGISR